MSDLKPLRVMSLYQPWATLMAIGEKVFETRSWSTRYRGLVAIHAAKSTLCDDMRTERYYAAALANEGPLPHGEVVAVGRLHDVQRTEITGGFLKHHHCDSEIAFGDYSSGRFAWAFPDVWRLKEPIKFSSHQGLFNAPTALRLLIAHQLPELDLV